MSPLRRRAVARDSPSPPFGPIQAAGFPLTHHSSLFVSISTHHLAPSRLCLRPSLSATSPCHFAGRRALRLHFTLFLNSTLSKTPSLLHQHLSPKSVDTFLATHALGAGPGRALHLEKAMRWREVVSQTPALRPNRHPHQRLSYRLPSAHPSPSLPQRGPTGEPTGLFKSRGQALEALVGAVYLEHGIAASSKVFHELVLPHLAFETRLAQALDAGGAEVGVEPEALRQAGATA